MLDAVRLAAGTLLGLVALSLFAAERSVMQATVPQDKLAEARSLTNPLMDSPQVIEQGKALYHGKGTCFNCHGTDGVGNGPASVGLDPSPRNFHQHGFWRHRTEGGDFLGDQAWHRRDGDASVRRRPHGRGDLGDHPVRAPLRWRSRAREAHGPASRDGAS